MLVFTASWTICKDGRKRAPPGLHTCVAPRACGQRGHDAGCRMQDAGWAGPWAANTLRSKAAGVPTPRPAATLSTQPHCLPRSTSPAVRFYKEKEHVKNRRGQITKLQLSVTNSKCWFQHVIREITIFTISSTDHRQIWNGRVFYFDVGFLIKNMKVLRECVKVSLKIFTVGLRTTDCTDRELEEAFVSQRHSKIPPFC